MGSVLIYFYISYVKKLILLLLIVPAVGMSQYFENVTFYEEYGNDLGSFEIESDSSDPKELHKKIEDATK